MKLQKNEVMGHLIEIDQSRNIVQKFAEFENGDVFCTGEVFHSAFFDHGELTWTKLSPEQWERFSWSAECIGPFNAPRHLSW